MPPLAKVTTTATKKKGEEVKAKAKAFRVLVHVIEVKDIKPLTSGLPDLVVTASVGKYGTKYTQVVRQCTAASCTSRLPALRALARPCHPRARTPAHACARLRTHASASAPPPQPHASARRQRARSRASPRG